MNNQTPHTTRSPILRFFRWLSTGRIVRRMLIILAWMVTLVALLYGVANWSGHRAWNNYRKQLEARGEHVDLKDFIPKPIPDEQNFAATPFIQSWFVRTNAKTGAVIPRFEWKDPYERAGAMVPGKRAEEKKERGFHDLVAWQMAFDAAKSDKPGNEKFISDKLDRASRAQAAPVVLDALKANDEMFAELRAAASRPYSQYPLFYNLENPWGILLPHLQTIRGASQRLGLKACAELALGENEKALADVKLILHLADSVKDEPFIISYLVRLAAMHIATRPVWEGLAEQSWSNAQLKELQARFANYNFLADLDWPLDGERAFGIMTPKLIEKKGLGLLIDLSNPAPDPSSRSVANLIGRVVPSGWYYKEMVNYCILFEAQLTGTYDPAGKRVFPAKTAAAARELERVIGGGRMGRGISAIIHHRVVASLMLPALGNLGKKAANAQVVADQVALACALERYRLAHNEFPETLNGLVPQFIAQMPHDVISGEPYKYRRTADGKFILYSVGWNETGNNGAPGRTLFDDKDGDWVWQY